MRRGRAKRMLSAWFAYATRLLKHNGLVQRARGRSAAGVGGGSAAQAASEQAAHVHAASPVTAAGELRLNLRLLQDEAADLVALAGLVGALCSGGTREWSSAQRPRQRHAPYFQPRRASQPWQKASRTVCMPVTSMRSSQQPSETLALRSKAQRASARPHGGESAPCDRARNGSRAHEAHEARRGAAPPRAAADSTPNSKSSFWRRARCAGAGEAPRRAAPLRTHSCEMRNARPWRPVNVCVAGSRRPALLAHAVPGTPCAAPSAPREHGRAPWRSRRQRRRSACGTTRRRRLCRRMTPAQRPSGTRNRRTAHLRPRSSTSAFGAGAASIALLAVDALRRSRSCRRRARRFDIVALVWRPPLSGGRRADRDAPRAARASSRSRSGRESSPGAPRLRQLTSGHRHRPLRNRWVLRDGLRGRGRRDAARGAGGKRAGCVPAASRSDSPLGTFAPRALRLALTRGAPGARRREPHTAAAVAVVRGRRRRRAGASPACSRRATGCSRQRKLHGRRSRALRRTPHRRGFPAASSWVRAAF